MPSNSLIKKILNVFIVLSFIFVFVQSFQYYKYLSSITCLGLQAPPKNFVIINLIPLMGLMLVLPSLLLFIRYFVLKKRN